MSHSQSMQGLGTPTWHLQGRAKLVKVIHHRVVRNQIKLIITDVFKKCNEKLGLLFWLWTEPLASIQKLQTTWTKYNQSSLISQWKALVVDWLAGSLPRATASCCRRRRTQGGWHGPIRWLPGLELPGHSPTASSSFGLCWVRVLHLFLHIFTRYVDGCNYSAGVYGQDSLELVVREEGYFSLVHFSLLHCYYIVTALSLPTCYYSVRYYGLLWNHY